MRLHEQAFGAPSKSATFDAPNMSQTKINRSKPRARTRPASPPLQNPVSPSSEHRPIAEGRISEQELHSLRLRSRSFADPISRTERNFIEHTGRTDQVHTSAQTSHHVNRPFHDSMSETRRFFESLSRNAMPVSAPKQHRVSSEEKDTPTYGDQRRRGSNFPTGVSPSPTVIEGSPKQRAISSTSVGGSGGFSSNMPQYHITHDVTSHTHASSASSATAAPHFSLLTVRQASESSPVFPNAQHFHEPMANGPIFPDKIGSDFSALEFSRRIGNPEGDATSHASVSASSSGRGRQVNARRRGGEAAVVVFDRQSLLDEAHRLWDEAHRTANVREGGDFGVIAPPDLRLDFRSTGVPPQLSQNYLGPTTKTYDSQSVVSGSLTRLFQIAPRKPSQALSASEQPSTSGNSSSSSLPKPDTADSSASAGGRSSASATAEVSPNSSSSSPSMGMSVANDLHERDEWSMALDQAPGAYFRALLYFSIQH